jgi:hypothetical protein
MVYGPEGVGKTTFASKFERPIFLGAEKGSSQLDVTRLPSPVNSTEVSEMIRDLTKESHDFKTLVIDSIDWIEPLIHDDLLRRYSVTSMKAVGGGYGAYVDILKNAWREKLTALDELRKRMHLVIVGHSQIKKFSDPEENCEYDRYELKMMEKSSAALIKEWVDCLLFVNYERGTSKENQKVRAVSTGERIAKTQWRVSHDAKNRFGMPEVLPFKYDVIVEQYILGNGQTVDELKNEVSAIANKLPEGDVFNKAAEAIMTAQTKEQLIAIKQRLQELTKEN